MNTGRTTKSLHGPCGIFTYFLIMFYVDDALWAIALAPLAVIVIPTIVIDIYRLIKKLFVHN